MSEHDWHEFLESLRQHPDREVGRFSLQPGYHYEVLWRFLSCYDPHDEERNGYVLCVRLADAPDDLGRRLIGFLWTLPDLSTTPIAPPGATLQKIRQLAYLVAEGGPRRRRRRP